MPILRENKINHRLTLFIQLFYLLFHRTLWQIGIPPETCRWWSRALRRTSCNYWPTIQAKAGSPLAPFPPHSAHKEINENNWSPLSCDQLVQIRIGIRELTSLSVKCDLSFSCSGVKCKILGCDDSAPGTFSTYRTMSKFSQQIKISTAPSSRAMSVSSSPKQYLPVSWLISSK